MDEHPPIEELTAYREGELAPAALLTVADHLATCSPCARKLGSSTAALEVWRDLASPFRAEEHLTDEELVGLAEQPSGGSSPEALHLSECDECRAAWQDLRLFRDRLSTPRETRTPTGVPAAAAPSPASISVRPAFWRLVLAMTVVAAMCAGIYFLSVAPMRRQLSRQAARARALEQQVAEMPGLRAALQQEQSRSQQSTSEAEKLRHEAENARTDSARLKEQLARLEKTPTPAPHPQVAPAAKPTQMAGGALTIPGEITALRGTRGTLLGAGDPAGVLAPQAPLGTAVANDRPEFRWTPVPGAASYELSVWDDQLNPVQKSGKVTSSQWTAAKPLPRGRNLRWEITAFAADGSELEHAPKPPNPPARFRVISAAEAQKISGEVAAAHLEQGRRYAAAGLMDDAEAELARAETLSAFGPANIHADAVKLLAQLRKARVIPHH
jgi:hypothetical protein